MSRRPTTLRSPSTGGREIRARVSAEEHAAIDREAAARGVTVPELVRELVLAAALAEHAEIARAR